MVERLRSRIAAKLALLLLPLVLLPFGSLGYFWYSSTRAELESQVRDELEARLRQFALRLQPFLRERELDLRDVASSPAVADYHVQLDYKLTEEAEVARGKLAEYLLNFVRLRQGFVAEILYINEQGIEVVAVTREGIHPKGRDRSDMALFQRARQAPPGDRLPPAVELSEDLGIDVYRLGVPIHNPWQEFRGVVGLDVAMGHIHAMLAESLAGRQGVPFLVDRAGRVLGPPEAREHLQRALGGAEGLAAALRALPAAGEATHVASLADGGGRGLFVGIPLGVQDWHAGLLAPLAETERRVAALTRFTLTYGVLAAVVLVGVVALLAGGASRRVRRLQAAAAQVAQGNFAQRLPAEARDEVGDLARSFNTMAESLARRDAEVRARTEEAERRRQELEVLNTVIHAAHASLNLRESLEAILDSLMALFQVRSGAVRLLDVESATLTLAAHRGLRPAYAANPVPLKAGEGHTGQALTAQRPLVFNDPRDLAALQERVAEGERAAGAIYIPILAQGQPMGAIALVADRPLDFTAAELNLLASIGLEVGSAIQNARLFTQTRTLLAEAERHRARAEALAAIGRAVTATLELERVLELVVGQTQEAMGADAVGILQWEGGLLRYVRSRGLPADHIRGLALKAGEGVAGTAALTRAPAWTGDCLEDPRFRDQGAIASLATEGIRALLAAPIILGDDVYGVLAILQRRPYTFSTEEVAFASAVAQQAAIAIQNARLYADLQEAYEQLKAAQDQAVQVEKLRAVGEMAAGVAHDFNNLLAAILGRAQLLRLRITDPQARAGLEVIERAALDGAETVRRILGFARTRGEEQMGAVEVEPMLRQVVEVTRPRWKNEAQARGAPIDVKLDLAPVPAVRGNAAELREVFVNLVFNAVDAMPAGGTITLGARPAPAAPPDDGRVEAVEVFVRDTGGGMPEHVRRRAFDPFFTTKGQRGSGLGLSVAYGIVTRHGGFIEVDSQEGAGTGVTVRLPAAAGAPAAAADPAPAAAPPARILVVDDEEMLAEMLAEMLRAQGHSVDAVSDPRLALERLAGRPVDLLVTDLGMPELSGWDLAVRAHALRPDLPVILVTGWGHQIAPEQLSAAGMAGVIAKPFRIEDVSRAVAAALNPQSSPA